MAKRIIGTSLQALLLLSSISCFVQQEFTTDKLSTEIPEEIVFSSSFSEAVSDTTDVYVDSQVEDISTITNDKYELGTNPSTIPDIINTKINTYEHNLVDSNGTTEITNNIENKQKNDEESTIRNPDMSTTVIDANWTEIINSLKRTMNALNQSRFVPHKVEVLVDDEVHVSREDINSDGNDHPCKRECKEGEEPLICYYNFRIEWYHTLSKACYNCPYNESDCSRKDCIPADGMSRPITVINRRMPGPAIEVCQGDRIIVDVENDLMVEGTTVHWHGQHQRDTPFMDGTPHVTQCPILPETTFRYQFFANNSGTHFWHSHSGMQRADGAAGALIVRTPVSRDRHQGLYDYDRSEHTMIITDWVHLLSLDMFTDHHHSKGDNKPPTLLINGLGRFKVFNTTTKPMYMRAARFNVEQGFKYRFRVINAEFLNCPIEISVDNHNITLIASDGHDVQPVVATSLVTYAGERFDFIVEASEEIDNYWIRFRGLMDCDERFTKAKQVAVLHYEGAMEDEPPGNLTWEESHNDGLQINALNKGEEENETISISELRSLDNDDETLKEKADYQFFVAYDFYPKNNSHFHKSPYYGYYQVPHKDNRLYTPQLNHISMKLPSSPLLVSRPSDEGFCNSTTISEECKEGYCECHHVLEVKTGSVVEVIIIDEGVTFDANHPFHLHGHSFRVVGLRRLASQITVDEVKAYDEAGLLKRNLKHAPIKDTVTVPDGGYTVIRFKADNPGYWLFHCHIEFHAEIGMSLVFKVGEHDEMARVPPHFPTCGDYIPDNMIEKVTMVPPLSDEDEETSYISLTHWWPLLYLNYTPTETVPAPEAASGSFQTYSILLQFLCITKSLFYW